MGKIVDTVLAWRKPKQLDLESYFAKLKSKGLNPDGTPILDPTPIAPPIGYKQHPSMVEIVRDMVRSEKLRLEALESGHETFEEAEDFDVGDDPEQLRSPYEDHAPSLSDLLAAGGDAKAAREKSGLPSSDGPQGAETPGGGGSAPPPSPEPPPKAGAQNPPKGE